MIECEKLGTLHFSVAYLGVVYLNQSYLIFFFSEKGVDFLVLYLASALPLSKISFYYLRHVYMHTLK